MTSSKILFYFCLCFIAGIFAGSLIYIAQLFLLGVFILGLFLISLFWKNKKIVLTGFCILFLALGIWRIEKAQFNTLKTKDEMARGLVKLADQLEEIKLPDLERPKSDQKKNLSA